MIIIMIMILIITMIWIILAKDILNSYDFNQNQDLIMTMVWIILAIDIQILCIIPPSPVPQCHQCNKVAK